MFAAKVPQVVTHDKVLVDCDSEFDEFIDTMRILKEKLGPLVLQFPKFDKWVLKSSGEFLTRLDSFLKGVSDPALRFAVEIRNKDWLNPKLTESLRAHNVALPLTDTRFGHCGLRICQMVGEPQRHRATDHDMGQNSARSHTRPAKLGRCIQVVCAERQGFEDFCFCEQSLRCSCAGYGEVFLATVERTALDSFCGCGGKTMKGRILASLFLFSLFIVVGGDAQSPNIPERPVWTLEFIKVTPENFGLAWGTWTTTGFVYESKLSAKVQF